MPLLFLHLSENGVFFDLDEISALFLGETEPEFLYALALLCGAGAPDLVLVSLCFSGGWVGLLALFAGGRG